MKCVSQFKAWQCENYVPDIPAKARFLPINERISFFEYLIYHDGKLYSLTMLRIFLYPTEKRTMVEVVPQIRRMVSKYLYI